MAQQSKKLETLSAIEKKIKRRLIQGKIEEAVEDLKYVISEYKELQMLDRANVLEITLAQFISENPEYQGNGNTESKIKKNVSNEKKRDFLQFLHDE